MVTQKDQVVTGDNAIFDTKTNLITMTGGVVLTQCKNVLRGDRLLVDMTTGVSRVERRQRQGAGHVHTVRGRVRRRQPHCGAAILAAGFQQTEIVSIT